MNLMNQEWKGAYEQRRGRIGVAHYFLPEGRLVTLK